MTEGDISAAEQYDAIIIGSGQGGGPLSTALAATGRRTALIEREYIGGTCINTGCSPTKTMVASARVAYLARRGAEYGVEIEGESIDQRVVRQRKRDIVESFRAGSEKAIEAGHVEIIMGEASFTGPKSIRVRLLAGGTRSLSAELFVIDTGSRPADPPLRGLDSVPHFNSTSIMELGEVPEHLLILGGGYIAVEFGQMFRRFGSRVTIVERGRHLLAREDPDIADEVRKIFEEDGIKVALNASADGVDAVEGGAIRLQVTVGDDEQALVGSQLLVATGRKPNSEALNLAAAGVDVTDHGVIQVNGRLETSAAGIYALGEVAGSPAFTHISYDDFRVLRTNLIEGGNRSTHGRMLPYTVFTDPQLGRIGLTETEARDAQINVRVAIMPMTHVARALEMGESRGMVKAVVDADTEEILGAAVLGIEGGEIMAMLQLAMMGKLRYSQLRDGIFAHPTLAELLNNLFSGFK
jgi:pyruvate/2-oxoglutarate dehydrogenase complex dihydrolipoamide dehydrogenase (E3) component